MKTADSSEVSAKAKQRGIPQGGTLGSGNYFLEIQVVREIYDPEELLHSALLPSRSAA